MATNDNLHERQRVCYSTPWVDFVEIFPTTTEAGPHFALQSKDYVSVVATTASNELLLVRQFRPAVQHDSLELPAGHVEPNQTPLEAAHQELIEETGYRAGRLELLGVLEPDTGRLMNRNWCFLASALECVSTVRGPDEPAELVRVDLADLRRLIVSGELKHAQHLAAIQLAVAHGKLSFLDTPRTQPALPGSTFERPRVMDRKARQMRKRLDVCVVGGAGHVGLPLSLVMADRGMRVLIYDTNDQTLAKIERGEMPFVEVGGDQLLRTALDSNALQFTSDASELGAVDNVIVAIGTPVDEYLNPNTKVIRHCLDQILSFVGDDQLIMLRSTLYPGTTNWLASQFRESGRHPLLAFCPERIVQGQAIKELPGMAQIVSGVTPEAEAKAAAFWSRISSHIVRLSPMEAEFAKLFCNAYRYIQFASANEFFMMATEAGVDFANICRGMKENYPRMRDFPSAGFAAGPCLLKDSMQLAAFARNRFSLGQAAMQVNEGLVLWLTNELSRRFPLASMTVGLLGMAFKAEIDDSRASLSYKLKKALLMRCHRVLGSDPMVTTDPTLIPIEELVDRSDLLILCTPHSQFRQLDLRGKPLIDIWGHRGDGSGLLDGAK
jgi:UDP-N-acetyl-D-mannosaminuronic acid dehydrogenase